MCLPVKFAKFSETLIFKNICEQLILNHIIFSRSSITNGWQVSEYGYENIIGFLDEVYLRFTRVIINFAF